MKLVTVFNSFSSIEAQMIRSLLESADIRATVTHEAAALTTAAVMTVGGIKVQVTEDQVKDALEIIKTKAPPPPSASS